MKTSPVLSNRGLILQTSPMQEIGVKERYKNHHKDNGQEHPNATEEAGEHDQNTAHGPEPAGKAVGLVPVFFVVEGPGDLDTDGIVLLT